MKEPSIVLFLMPHTNLLDLGGVIQAFREVKEFGISLKLIICSEEKEVSTIADFSLKNVKDYRKIKPGKGDYLLVMSADYKYVFSGRFRPSKEILNWLTGCHHRGARIGAVCNGAFLLGKAGLLDHVKCTTHWRRTDDLQAMFPLAKVQENILYTEDKNILTSAGSASGIDLALHMIAELKGDFYSHLAARELVVFGRRNGEHLQQGLFLQYRNHLHKSIHSVQDHIISHIGEKLNISRLAALAHMSERNLCRVFKKETAITVFEYINQVRSVYIRELLKNPDLSQKQIANKVGLESERQVNRIRTKYMAG